MNSSPRPRTPHKLEPAQPPCEPLRRQLEPAHQPQPCPPTTRTSPGAAPRQPGYFSMIWLFLHDLQPPVGLLGAVCGFVRHCRKPPDAGNAKKPRYFINNSDILIVLINHRCGVRYRHKGNTTKTSRSTFMHNFLPFHPTWLCLP